MNRVELKHIALRGSRFSGLAPKVHRVLFGLFLLQFTLVWARLWLPWPPLGNARWPDGLLLVLTAATILASLTRQLPGQNVMLASVIIAFIAGAAQSLGALTAIPFGPYVYAESFGQQLFYPLPWAVPLVWIAVIFPSRGVARLILRPWRKTRTYGFWLIGLATALVVLLDLGLEPFATRVKHYWFWNPTKLKLDWYGTPWVNFLGWAVTTLLILAFATPLPHQQETDAPAPSGLCSSGRLAPDQSPVRDRRCGSSPLAGPRADLAQQRCRGCLCPPRRALVSGKRAPGSRCRIPPPVLSGAGLAANRGRSWWGTSTPGSACERC